MKRSGVGESTSVRTGSPDIEISSWTMSGLDASVMLRPRNKTESLHSGFLFESLLVDIGLTACTGMLRHLTASCVPPVFFWLPESFGCLKPYTVDLKWPDRFNSEKHMHTKPRTITCLKTRHVATSKASRTDRGRWKKRSIDLVQLPS